eukprot:888720_1
MSRLKFLVIVVAVLASNASVLGAALQEQGDTVEITIRRNSIELPLECNKKWYSKIVKCESPRKIYVRSPSNSVEVFLLIAYQHMSSTSKTEVKFGGEVLSLKNGVNYFGGTIDAKSLSGPQTLSVTFESNKEVPKPLNSVIEIFYHPEDKKSASVARDNDVSSAGGKSGTVQVGTPSEPDKEDDEDKEDGEDDDEEEDDEKK